MTCYATFETALGWAGLAWNEAGLTGVRLPTGSCAAARTQLAERFGGAEAEPDDNARAAISEIRRLLGGEKVTMSAIRLDLSRTPEFHARVYEIARAIEPGQTLTYGEVALRLGDRLLAQSVGQALGKNPWPIVVPCHRVTGAGGKLGGFSAPGGAVTKLKLLAIEGAAAAAQRDLFA
jgi:methylated-DNA-[protein]-cysteine S-methyltransferase